MNRFLFAKHAEDRAPSGRGPQARWLCCSLLTYRDGYASPLAPRQRAGGLQQNANLFLREPLAVRLLQVSFFELPRLPVLPDPIPVKVSAVHRYVNTGREALSERQGAS